MDQILNFHLNYVTLAGCNDPLLFFLKLNLCALGLSSLRLLSNRSQTSQLKGQRPRPHIHRRDKQDNMGKRREGASHLGKPSRLIIIVI